MHNWENREEIDGCNSSSVPKTFFDLGCDKFNDLGHRPVANVHTDLHDEYLEPIDFFDDEEHTMPLVTPNKLKISYR